MRSFARKTMAASPATTLPGSGDMPDIERELAALSSLKTHELRRRWQRMYGAPPPVRLSHDLLVRGVAYKVQESAHGGLAQSTKRKLRTLARRLETDGGSAFDPGLSLKPGARLVREWGGRSHTVIVLEDGFDFDGRRYPSLSKIARAITGAHWSGPRFFGLQKPAKPFSGSAEATHG